MKRKCVDDLPEVCTLQTLAESGLVDVRFSTLRSWCVSGEYPRANKIGQKWFVNPKEFIGWMSGKGPRAK